MIKKGQSLTQDILNKAFVSKTGTGTQILFGSLSISGNITATSFIGDGLLLTNLNASNLSSGAVPDARLSSNIALLNGTQIFTANNTFSNKILATSGMRVTSKFDILYNAVDNALDFLYIP